MYVLRLLVDDGLAAQGNAADIEQCLRGAGFRVSHLERDEAICVAVFSSGIDNDFWFKVGEACGKGREVLLVTNSESQVPQSAKSLPILRSLEGSFEDSLLRAVSEMLGIQDLSAPEDPEQLARWVAKDEDRLAHLSPQQLSTLCRWLVFVAGYEASNPSWAKFNDLMISDPSTSTKFLIQWEPVLTKNALVEIGDLCEFHRRCSTANVDFSILVTNGKFSNSALRWSSECVPAMRLLDQDDVINNIRKVLRRGSGDDLRKVLLGPIKQKDKATYYEDVKSFDARELLRDVTEPEQDRVNALNAQKVAKKVEPTNSFKIKVFSDSGAGRSTLELKYLTRQAGVSGMPNTCLVIHSGGDDRDVMAVLVSRLQSEGVGYFDIKISSAESVRQLRDFKSKAMIWIIAPGLFSKERSRFDGMALSQVAHLFNEFSREKPLVIFLTSGLNNERQRVPACFDTSAVWVPWQKFDWGRVAKKVLARISADESHQTSK